MIETTRIKISEEDAQKLRLPDISIETRNGQVIDMGLDRISLDSEYHFGGIDIKGDPVYLGQRKLEDVFSMAKSNPNLKRIAGYQFPERGI